MDTNDLRAYQAQQTKEREEQLERLQQENQDYLQSEAYQRESWEKYQDLWEQKAKKEGWHYTRKPFVSAADRQRVAEQSRQQEIAYLEEKIRALKG